jgi:hypothetical protein
MFRYGLIVDDINTHPSAYLQWHKDNNCKLPLLLRLRYILNGFVPIQNVFLDRCLTFLLHFIVCSLIYRVFNSVEAALLFAVMPSNTQVAIWLNGKRYAVNAILCLLSMLYMPYTMIFWFITPLFQVSAITFPIILAFSYNWLFILVMPIALLIDNKHIIMWAKSRAKDIKYPILLRWDNRKILFMLKTYSFYFIRGIFPHVPAMWIPYMRDFGMSSETTKKAYSFDLNTFFGLLIVTSIPFIYRLDSNIGFGLIWWAITIFVFSNYISITMIFSDRYMYLPNIGLMFALVHCLKYIHTELWLIVFGLYAGVLLSNMNMYKDLFKFLEHHTYHFPTNEDGWKWLVRCRIEQKNTVLALQTIDNAIVHNCHAPELYMSKANILCAFKDKNGALDNLNKAESICGGDQRKILNKNMIEIREQIKLLGEQK